MKLEKTASKMKNNNPVFDKIKEESMWLLYLFICLVVVFKIVFYKENISTLIHSVFGLFWLFILPGFALMFIWKDNFDFIERLIGGSVLSVAIIGLTSYNLTLLNVNIRLQYILVPLSIEVISITIIYFLTKQKVYKK